jgi:hypothetical protein
VHDGTDYMDTLAIENLAVPEKNSFIFSYQKIHLMKKCFTNFLGDKI